MADGDIIETAPAKINLDLLITGRRDDGYHELDSVVVFAEIGDVLHFQHSSDFSLKITGPFGDRLLDEPDNIILRTARLLAERSGHNGGAEILLDKRLPVAAGIGGGSSDAGATLRGLNRLWNLQKPLIDLITLGSELGADVPVCTYAAPARMRGIGERLDPIRGLPDLPLVLINPLEEVPTGSVFAKLELPLDAFNRPSFRAHPTLTMVATWLQVTSNELQPPAIDLVPAIATVIERIEIVEDVLLARMSGSGATCFALMSNDAAARDLADTLSHEFPKWWVCATMVRTQQ